MSHVRGMTKWNKWVYADNGRNQKAEQRTHDRRQRRRSAIDILFYFLLFHLAYIHNVTLFLTIYSPGVVTFAAAAATIAHTHTIHVRTLHAHDANDTNLFAFNSTHWFYLLTFSKNFKCCHWSRFRTWSHGTPTQFLLSFSLLLFHFILSVVCRSFDRSPALSTVRTPFLFLAKLKLCVDVYPSPYRIRNFSLTHRIANVFVCLRLRLRISNMWDSQTNAHVRSERRRGRSIRLLHLYIPLHRSSIFC